MINMKRFGAYISKLRKEKDLTQSLIAERLNITRQAVSKWELGESFPDISYLPELAEILGVKIDTLVNAGETCLKEGSILAKVAEGRTEEVAKMVENKELSVGDVLNVAPVLRASALDIITGGFKKHGIDICHLASLAEYINEASFYDLLKQADFKNLDESMLSRVIPFLNDDAKEIIFTKIIDGELSIDFLQLVLPYMRKYFMHIEASVIEGVLDEKALIFMHEYSLGVKNA